MRFLGRILFSEDEKLGAGDRERGGGEEGRKGRRKKGRGVNRRVGCEGFRLKIVALLVWFGLV